MINKVREKLVIGIIFLVLSGILINLYIARKEGAGPAVNAGPSYSQVYRLVAEKISQSALVVINLPPNVSSAEAQKNVVFTPELAGKWVKSESASQLIFKPAAKLNLDRYYKVALAVGDKGTIQADFLAVEDPKAIAIFPTADSETSENSEITIIFNRPMVPLTTLGYLEGNALPIEITPVTEGKFKWITTRNLQFIPKEKLKTSSNYTVKVKAGMLSADGLPVQEFISKFVTRRLRYVDARQNLRSAEAPMVIMFNQPVDLEKTKKEIIVKDLETGKEIPFIAEYATFSGKKAKISGAVVEPMDFISRIKRFFTGSREAVPSPANGTGESVDVKKDTIWIYKAQDKFGRGKFWDYNSNYTVSFNKAYPLEGDVILEESYTASMHTDGPIESIRVESPRYMSVSQDFFDPQGKVWVNFREEIDTAKSDIRVPKIRSFGYGEKCKEGVSQVAGKDCEKVPDKKKIFFTFNSDEFGFEETANIIFSNIVNTDGFTLNKNSITESLKTYPVFKILSTSPSDGDDNSSLTEVVLCANSPISVPPEKEIKDHLVANHSYVLNYWPDSHRVENFYDSQSAGCKVGEFATRINYGLDPETDYVLNFKLEDPFGQKLDQTLRFKTDLMPSENLSFYQMQEIYNITTPGKTKLTYAVRNMEYVNLEICKLGALDFTGYLEDGIDIFTPSGALMNCQKVVKDKIDLPKRYWTKNYFNVNMEKYFPSAIGHYVLTFSNPNYFARKWEKGSEIEKPAYERTYLTVTNLGIAEKRINLNSADMDSNDVLPSTENLTNLYWVTDLTTLAPVEGAKVTLWQKNKSNFKSLASYSTDDKGVVTPKSVNGIDEVIVTKGDDSAIILIQKSSLTYGSLARVASRFYLYTDKPIYQPTQTVYFKGLYRIGYDGNYEIFRDKKVKVKGYNSKGDEIYSEDLGVSDYGTFDAKLILDKDSPLGGYRVCIENNNCTYFEIQEYVPAPFKVDLKSDKEEYVSKDTANIEVNADYYFGVPLESGTVQYTITSQNYYFDRYTDGYFDFGSGWYYGDFSFYGDRFSYGDRYIANGTVQLSKDGKANISQNLDLEDLFSDSKDKSSKIIVIDATVQNSSGQSVSSQKSFIVHAGEFYLGINSNQYYAAKNESIKLDIKSVNDQGKPIRVQNITGRKYQINWVYNKRQEATGGYASNWERQRKDVGNFQFGTDENGNYSTKASFSEEGEYEIEVSAQDSKGNTVKGVQSIYIYGEKEVSIQPMEGTDLELDAKKTALNVGDKGEIIIKSPYQRAKALIAIERGRVFSYEIKDIEGSIYSYSFDVAEKYSPNFYVSVLLVSSKPEIRFGEKEFTVDTDRQKLNIEVKSNKKFYLPGEEVSLDIYTTDYQGKPKKAEVSAAVIDLSVLALQGNPKKNPVDFFYGGFPLTVSTFSNVKNILIESNIVETKGGGGGADEGALGNKKRGEFKENAFWQAMIRTGEDGRANVKFTLPDNLTTWQAETLGITQDTKLGVNYLEFTTKKQLMVVPLKPRFIVPGDEFSIGAQVFNETDQRQEISVDLFSTTLELNNDKANKKIMIEAGQSVTVYYGVKAPSAIDRGTHAFTFAAKGRGVQDMVEQSINITQNDTYEATATANYTASPVEHEYVFLPDNIIKDKGSLTVNSSATLAVFLSDSLKYLLEYPYGCSEQISSKLNSIAVIKRGLNLPNVGDKFNLGKIMYDGKEYTTDELVEVGLAKLYNNQRGDGGFALWQDYGYSNFHTTLQAVETLNNLKEAGYKINEDSLSRASDYVYREMTSNQSIYQDKNNLILAAYVLFSLDTLNYKNNIPLNQKLGDIVKDDLFLKERISNTSLAYLGIMAGADLGDGSSGIGRNPFKKKILDTLDNRINIDSRGSFLEMNKNHLWYYYETPVKNTALYLKAIVANKSNNPIADKVLRWLLASRAKDGSWGSTNNTITAVDAMTDYLAWKRETESEFTLNLAVNGNKESSFLFNKATILDQNSKVFPLSALKTNENNIILFTKENKNNLSNNFYYDMSLKYYLPQDKIAPRDEGFSITREFYAVGDLKNKTPLKEAKVGDVLREHLVVTVSESRNFVGIEDYIPAGMEIVNLDLATEQKSLLLQDPISQGRSFDPNFKELRNDRAFLYRDNIAPGVYEFDYYTRALIKGKFTHLPAVVSEMYFPENFGRTAGGYFEIK